ncbi:MAG: ATP-binding protein [Rhodospirillaceae bacterium]
MASDSSGSDVIIAGSSLSDPECRVFSALAISEVERELLASVLAEPWSVVVEFDDKTVPSGDWAAVRVPENGLYLSLSTATSYGLQLSGLLSGVLVARGVISAERRSVIELCLQEAVANAIIHGNLGIPSTAKDHPEGYRVFSQLVNERLRDPLLRSRRIELFARRVGLALVISVLDQGSGFDQAGLPREVNGSKRSGRGFVFMRALANDVTVSDGGRCTSLRFDP